MSQYAFCMECNKEREYMVKKIVTRQMVKGKEFKFKSTIAYCTFCGEEVNVPGMMDQNMKQEDEQVRSFKRLISIQEINELMDMYHMGKAPLSLALGFGEVTLTRYLDGQMPSQTYSEIMRNALQSYDYMERLLTRNRDKLADTAYKKACKKIEEYRRMDELSEELLMVVSYIFRKNPEVSAYALHKLLYFIQGIYMAFYQEKLFPEDCIASAKGPLYQTLYEVLKDFHYSPVEDPRYHFLENRWKMISDEAKTIINLVLETFGIYSGASLEVIIKKETPWLHARVNVEEDADGSLISENDMHRYFLWVIRKFGMDNTEHMNHYIRYKLTV